MKLVVIVSLVVPALGMTLLTGCGDDSNPPAASAQSAQSTTYTPQMQALCNSYAGQGLSATWPSNGNDAVLRIDLPRTNGDISDHTARQMASDAYDTFVAVRQKAGVSDPANCIVHVYDDTGKQISHASESGAEN